MTTPQKPPLNGVDVPTLFATLDVVKARPAAARFQFRASNRWLAGTHSRTTIGGFYGAGQEHEHNSNYSYEADHPEVLVGQDNAPTPVEFLLHALAASITAGIGNIAASKGIKLDRVECGVEGDIDVMGLLGLDTSVRNGYQNINVAFQIEGDSSTDELREVVESSVSRSAVYDVLTNGVPVNIEITE